MEEHGNLYFSIWYGVLDVDSGALAYASGGHPPALVLSADGRVVDRLATRNPPIGTLGPRKFTVGGARLERDQRLLVFSDGAYEVTDSSGREGTLEDFETLLAEQPRATPQELHASICARGGRDRLDDDYTLLVVDRGRQA